MAPTKTATAARSAQHRSRPPTEAPEAPMSPGDLIALAQSESVSPTPRGPLEHWQWALALPATSDALPVPRHVEAAEAFRGAMGSAQLTAARQWAITYWSNRKEALRPAWHAEDVPSHVRDVLGPSIVPDLLLEMATAAGYPDAKLVADGLRQGFPITGTLPCYAPRLVADRSEEERDVRRAAERRLHTDAAATNEAVLRKVHGSRPTKDEEEALAQEAEKEIGRNRAARFPSPGCAARTGVLCPRFAVLQGSKYRVIDDLTLPGVNAACLSNAAITYEGIDCVIAAAQRKVTTGWRPSRVLTLGKQDFKSAYKTLAVASKDLPYTRCAFRAHGAVQALQLTALPFGAVGSVHAWDMVGEAVQWTLASIYGVASTRYVDDLIFVEWEEHAEETAVVTKTAAEGILGWGLDERKATTGTRDCVVLGVRMQVVEEDEGPPRLLLTIPDDKAARWAADIDHALATDQLTPADARTLCGRLAWGSSVVFDAVARPYAWPLHRRAQSGKPGLTDRLRKALVLVREVTVRRAWLRADGRRRFSPVSSSRSCPSSPSQLSPKSAFRSHLEPLKKKKEEREKGGQARLMRACSEPTPAAGDTVQYPPHLPLGGSPSSQAGRSDWSSCVRRGAIGSCCTPTRRAAAASGWWLTRLKAPYGARQPSRSESHQRSAAVPTPSWHTSWQPWCRLSVGRVRRRALKCWYSSTTRTRRRS